MGGRLQGLMPVFLLGGWGRLVGAVAGDMNRLNGNHPLQWAAASGGGVLVLLGGGVGVGGEGALAGQTLGTSSMWTRAPLCFFKGASAGRLLH